MAERVSTGGLKTFDYKSSNSPKLSDKEKQEIRDAYKKAEYRKAAEKTRRNLIIIIVSILAILAIGGLTLRYLF